MARRRFNTRFAIWLGAGAATVACLGVGLRFALRSSPHQLVVRGDSYAAAGNLQGAHECYQQALARDARLLDVWIKDGEVIHKLAEHSPDQYGVDRDDYSHAAASDPKFLPAQQRLLEGDIQMMRNAGAQAAIYSMVQETAAAVHDLDPTDVRAEAFTYIAPLIAWTRDIPATDKVVADDLKALQALLPKISSDADVRFFTASVLVHQGRDLARQGDTAGARKHFDQALAIMSDGVKAAPENADMHMDYGVILEQTGPSFEDNYTPAQRQAASEQFLKNVLAEFEAARKNVTPADNQFLEIYATGAEFQRKLDQHKAEAICHDLLNIANTNQKARLLLAEISEGDPAERDNVISLLREPIGAITEVPWGVANIRQTWIYQTNLELEKYLLDSYNSAPADRRPELLSQIQELYQSLADHEGVDYRVLKERGIMEALQGGDGMVKSVQTLEAAQRLAAQKKQNDLGLDQMLVESYVRNHQTGPAKILLQQMIALVPEYVDFRLRLAGLLLDDHDTDGASIQLDKLTQVAPNDSRVQNLMVRYYLTMQQQGDANQAKQSLEKMHQIYAKLPESNADEQWDKSILALRLGDGAEAERLLQDIRKKTPSDLRVVEQLITLYQQLHQKDKAVAVLDDAIKGAAQNQELTDQFKLILAQVNGEKADQIEKLLLTSIEHVSDPTQRELRYYSFYFDERNMPEALKHLAAAEKADPHNAQVLSARFTLALNQQSWDDAERYARALGDQNADHAGGLLYQFQIAQSRQDIGKQMDIARQMTRTKPEFSKSWELLGKAMEARGLQQNDNTSLDEAISNYGIALDKQSENQEALLGIIQCYLAEGKSDAALNYIQRGLKINPASQLFREEEVQYDLRYGDPHNAVAVRREQLDTHPQAAQAWLLLGNACVDCVRYDVAHGLKNPIPQDMATVRDTVNDALKRWPDEHAFYSLLAQAAQISGDTAAGESALKTVAARDLEKHLAQGTLMLANFYVATGKSKEAEAALSAIRHKCVDDELVSLRLATLYADENRIDDSLKVLDPNSPDSPVQEQIARLLLHQGKLDQAREVVDRQLDALTAASNGAANKLPASAPSSQPSATQPLSFSDTRTPTQRQSMYLSLRALIDLAQNHAADGASEIAKALSLDPHNAEALSTAAALAMQQSPPDYKVATEHLTLLRNLHPDDVNARLGLAEVYRRQGDMENAIHELELARQYLPGNKSINQNLLMLYSQCHPPRWLDEERLLAALQSTPEGQKDADWARAQAVMWSQRSDPDKAIAAAQQALSLAPNDQRVEQLITQILLNAQRYSDTVSVCNQLLAVPANVKAAWIYQIRAVAEHKLGQEDAASADFQKTFGLVRETGNTPTMVSVMLQMSDQLGATTALAAIQPLMDKPNKDIDQLRVVAAELYVAAHEGSHAMSLVDTVIADKAKFPPQQLDFALTACGDICLQMGDVDRAQTIYRQVLAQWPNNVEALNDLANILCDRVVPPQLNDALKYSERAAAVISPDNPNYASILDTRGWALTLAGHLDEGVDYLLQSLKHRDLIEAHYHLGQAYLRKQMVDDAVTQLQLATKMVNDLHAVHRAFDPAMEGEIENALASAKESQAKLRAQANQ